MRRQEKNFMSILINVCERIGEEMTAKEILQKMAHSVAVSAPDKFRAEQYINEALSALAKLVREIKASENMGEYEIAGYKLACEDIAKLFEP
jgi:hypothetical protein